MNPNVKPITTLLKGGLDLVTPAAQIDPGRMTHCVNYECDLEGGYSSIQGYQDFSSSGDPPGTGGILGVAYWDDNAYAIRETVGAGTAQMWKSSGAAWTSIGSGLPIGRYDFAIGNFYAAAVDEKLYFVCDQGKPYYTDGATVTQIAAAPSGAKYVVEHDNYLILGFEAGSLQGSTAGDPTDWTTSAWEIGLEDHCCGMLSVTGGVLVVGGQRHVKALYGSSPATFDLKIVAPNVGVKHYTMQSMVDPMFLFERGMTSLQAAQEFGDFQVADWGHVIEPYFENNTPTPIATLVSKKKGQFRVWFDDGAGFFAAFAGREMIGLTAVLYPKVPAVTFCGEHSNGQEVLLMGTSSGEVFQMDSGTSFDGAEIESIMVLAHNHFKAPTVLKRFYRLFLDVRGQSTGAFQILPSFDFGDSDLARHRTIDIATLAAGGHWGLDDWGEFLWSTPSTDVVPVPVSGRAKTMNIRSYHSSATELPHQISNYVTHLMPLRLARR
jgi:hypothetical protein